jgi:hypothetical protein
VAAVAVRPVAAVRRPSGRARVPVVGGGRFSARASRSDTRARGGARRPRRGRFAASAVRFVVRRRDLAHSLRRPRRLVDARPALGRDGESVCLQSVACPSVASVRRRLASRDRRSAVFGAGRESVSRFDLRSDEITR